MDLFLAIAALFGAGMALSSHASNANADPTTLDVATVLGQGTVAAGKAGKLNGLAPYLPQVHNIEAFGLAVQTHTNEAWKRHLGMQDSVDGFIRPELHAPDEEAVIKRSELTVPAALDGGYAGPDPNNYRATRARTEAEVQASFAPTVRILSAALSVVEWGAMPLFGSCFGIFSGDLGNIDGPDQGNQLRASKVQFAAGLGGLAYAYPNSPEWDSPSAVEYANLDGLMYSLTAQAGVDGMISIYGIDTNTSLDTLAYRIIDHQAYQVELMMTCLAAIGLGLMACIVAALYLGGLSWQYQLTMAGLGVGAAAAVVGVMAHSWASQNEADLNTVADAFTALAACVPSGPPPEPPSAGLLAAASAAGLFTGLAESATPKSAGPVNSGRALHQTPPVPGAAPVPAGTLIGGRVAAQSPGKANRYTTTLRPGDSSTRPGAPTRSTTAGPGPSGASANEGAGAAAAAGADCGERAATATDGADQLATTTAGKPRRALPPISPIPPIPDRKAER